MRTSKVSYEKSSTVKCSKCGQYLLYDTKEKKFIPHYCEQKQDKKLMCKLK